MAKPEVEEPVPAYVVSMLGDSVRVYARDARAIATLRALGASRGWLERSFWTLRYPEDDDVAAAALFGKLRDAGIGFQDDNRDYPPAAFFESFVQRGLLSGDYLRVVHGVNGLGRPPRPRSE